MDDKTKATVRALLDLHPRGYAGELGIQVTKSPKGLFRLLCLSLLADDTAPSEAIGVATRALGERGLDSAPEVAQSSEEERAELLREAGYGRTAEAAQWLHKVAELVIDRYDGDLNNLLDEAGGDHDKVVPRSTSFPAWTRPASASSYARSRWSAPRSHPSPTMERSRPRSGSVCRPTPAS